MTKGSHYFVTYFLKLVLYFVLYALNLPAYPPDFYTRQR